MFPSLVSEILIRRIREAALACDHQIIPITRDLPIFFHSAANASSTLPGISLLLP